ncbi:ribosomal protein L37AE/L43A [Catenibacillus scindens]|uniref:Ribosomal protein L37AE/L43A n=1 Tax=Catenibacillus scindens TaxID=673271 RepID=A0A7W8H7H7_9FIRM|nr:hypothetical protein [Catenibacillus scindens]MBB5262938.1 ribosomal protein L37AE/L43A [Catenibacillus scindens]
MSLLDDLKKSVTDFTENVAQKSTQVIETQKLKMKKSSLESDLRDIYVVLGHLYVRQLGSGFDEGSEEGRLLKRLNETRSAIASIEDELRQRKGMIICPGCRESVSADFDYCPKCGAKLAKEASDEKTSQEDVPGNGEAEEKTQTPEHDDENTDRE